MWIPSTCPSIALYINPAEADDALDPANAIFFTVGTGPVGIQRRRLAASAGMSGSDAATNAVQAAGALHRDRLRGPEGVGQPCADGLLHQRPSAGDGIHDSMPVQGATLDHPALVSDMLMPLYPFDTPFSDPIIFYDMPAAALAHALFRFGGRLPGAGGARRPVHADCRDLGDLRDADLALLSRFIPAAFQSKNAYEDNDSYYWRVRIRHERYVASTAAFTTTGPGRPRCASGSTAAGWTTRCRPTGSIAAMTPTFTWDRVEGAVGLQAAVGQRQQLQQPAVQQEHRRHQLHADQRPARRHLLLACRHAPLEHGDRPLDADTMSFVKQSRVAHGR